VRKPILTEDRNGGHWRLLHHGRRDSAAYFPATTGLTVCSAGFCERLWWIRDYEANAGHVQAYDTLLRVHILC